MSDHRPLYSGLWSNTIAESERNLYLSSICRIQSIFANAKVHFQYKQALLFRINQTSVFQDRCSTLCEIARAYTMSLAPSPHIVHLHLRKSERQR